MNNPCRVSGYKIHKTKAMSALTNDNERIVDVHAPKAIGGFTDVRPCVICLHLLDLQAHTEDTEPNPAAVDVPSVFGPH